MNVSAALKNAQTTILRYMAATGALVGIILILQHKLFDFVPGSWPEVVSSVAEDVGIALVIAVILALSIEGILRQRLVEDVFKASIGYILPEELKEEVRALYEAPLICTEHNQESTLREGPHPDLAILETKTRRTFKNITSSPYPFRFRVSVTEWLHDPSLPSRIPDMGVVVQGRRLTAYHVQREKDEGLNKFAGIMDEEIVLKPDESCTCWYTTVETKRSTDVANFVFIHPTHNPHASFRFVPKSPTAEPIIVNIRFNSRHAPEAVEAVGDTRRLRGTLVPHQGIELRWFTRSKFDAWVADVDGGRIDLAREPNRSDQAASRS